MKATSLKNACIIGIFALTIVTSCKNKDNPANDGSNNADGSFHENHTEQAVDTSGPTTDSITSNSTQTDPAAN